MNSKVTKKILSEIDGKMSFDKAIIFLSKKTGLSSEACERNLSASGINFLSRDFSKEAIVVENEISEDEIELTSSFGIKTLEELLEVSKVDLKEWSVEFFKPNAWPAMTKAGPIQFHQAKAVLKRKIPRKAKACINTFLEEIKKYSPHPEKIHTFSPSREESCLLEICAFDLHLGKYGKEEQVGRNYDTEKAKKIFKESIIDIATKASRTRDISRIVFPVGNDFLNVDTNAKTTTAGTPQDCDGSFAEMFRNGRELLVETIYLLKEFAPVDVVVVPGNHDTSSMFHLGDALSCWFHNDKEVTVDNGMKSRKYYSFGKNLIVYSHGDKEKADKLPIIAATEEPELWAATKFREIRLGHLHHEIVKEYNGVKVRYVPSLSGNDLYHYDRGYTENIRVAQGFLFCGTNGLESIIYSKPIV